MIATPEQLEQELTGFKFRGEGWYVSETDVTLIIETNKVGMYWCIVWNGVDPREELGKVFKLKEYTDESNQSTK